MTTANSIDRLVALHVPLVPLALLQPAQAELARLTVNQGPRPVGLPGIACVVLHATADGGNERGAEDWLCDPASYASAHLVVRRDGTVVRVVPDHRRAWHAGVSVWRGVPNVNDFSLGWEMANRNDGVEPYSSAQYASVVRLAVHYARQGMPAEAFVSHASVALPQGRKTDPADFDWTRFRQDVRTGVGMSPTAT